MYRTWCTPAARCCKDVELIIPYAMSVSATSFATCRLDEVLAAME